MFDLLTRDELECIYLHLSSLRHFRDMLEKVQKPTGTLAEPLRDDPPAEEPEAEIREDEPAD